MTMQPSFESEDSGGLTVIDPIERHRYTLSTPGTVTPEPADTAGFRFPVDTAVSVHIDALSLSNVGIHVRDESGRAVGDTEHFGREDFPAGQYTIEVSAPVKLYLRVESEVAVSTTAERLSVDFGTQTEVMVGARSYHDGPTTTVTTTADPEDMMRAISTFGSALKTASPERSFPTLRGHPPTIELGDSLNLAGLEPPETGVTIEVPPTYRAIYVVSPLAYYLDARVVPGDDPLLRTKEEFAYRLSGPEGFERTVERTLKQVFFLDCLTRTEGLYPVELHERQALNSTLDLDFAALYDQPLTAQLEAYLTEPFDALAAQIPEWKLTTYVEPTPTSVEMLPFVVSDLPIVRCENPAEATDPAETVTLDGETQTVTARNETFTRSTTTNVSTETDSAFVKPESTESLEQAWIGEGTPLGASKATVEAYRNRLNRTPNEGDLEIAVVCNDAAMGEEGNLVDEIYGDHEKLPFDVTVKYDLTTAEFANVLSNQSGFLHYVGHVDRNGFECADRKLDTTTLDAVGVDAFLLNACQSYRQGMRLIDSGAIGGIVTLADVLNCEAVTMGRTLAGMLNCGFPLRAALEVARDESAIGDDYLVVGDGNLSIAQTESGTPNLLSVERNGESFDTVAKIYPSANAGMGSVINPLRDDAKYYIAGGEIRECDFSREELKEYLRLENQPVKIDNELRWTRQIQIDDL